MMEDEDNEVDQTLFDSVILQVFEEQEDRCGSLRYPLSTQRDALDFVKLINRKGFPYVMMCQAIEEKQEKFRSWRLGNGNAYIGVTMMKRINKTVQEAMMLPDADADVDIDDLIDDDDDEEKDDTELAVGDLTTDDEEQHPTTSSSASPQPATDQVDDDAPVAAAADTTDDDTKTTSAASEHDDDVTEDKTTELTESQASFAELQSTDQQQQPSASTDDLKPTTDTTGRTSDDLPEQSLTADELQTEDTGTSRQEDVDETVSQGEAQKDDDYMNNLAENRPEVCIDVDDKVQAYSSDTPDTANQEVCRSTESDDINPSASAASGTESTSALPTSLDQPQHYEVVDTRHEKLKPTTEDQNIENDMECAAETTDQREMEQNDRDVSDENNQNELQIADHLELHGKNDHKTDSSTTLSEEDHSTSMTETQQPSVHDTTAVDVEKRNTIVPDDEMTSQQDVEVGHEDDKVTENSEVSEQAMVTEEEMKVTYEASAKQLNLLSRLAMLREKAAQRKAQQAADGESTPDGPEASSCENHEPSTHRDESTGSHDQSYSLQRQQKDDAAHPLSKRSVEIEKDKETSSETDRQTDVSTIDVDTEQKYTKFTGSPSQSTIVDKSKPGQVVSRSDRGHYRSNESPSAITHAVAEGLAPSTAEHASLSTTEKSTTHTREEVSTEKVLNERSKMTNDSSDDINMSTQEDANVNKQLQTSESISSSANTYKQYDEFVGPSTAIDSTLEQTTAQRALDQPALAQPASDTVDSGISSARTAADVDVQLVPVHSESDNTRELTDTGEVTDSELHGTATTASLHAESVVSSGPGAAEPTCTAQSDTATSELSTEKSGVTRLPTEPSSEPTQAPYDDKTAINYDSDLDDEFADDDALRLLSDMQRLKARTTDGAGFLYIFADLPRRRFKIGASRSPAKRLRQAITFNPDITLLVCVPVTGRHAAVGELRQRLRDVITPCVPGSRDWFTGSDDVMTEHVRQVAAAI